MAELNIATSGVLLSPGAPGYIAALNAMGYQFGEGTPLFALAGLPPVYAAAAPGVPTAPDATGAGAGATEPGRGPFVAPPASPTTMPPVSGVPAPGVTGVSPGRPAVQPSGPTLPGVLDVFGGIKDRIVGFLGDSLGAVFDGVTAVVRRITDTVGELAQATLPTIQELATAVASTATGALTFLADNLTDMADFGATLAGALIEPLYALGDDVAAKMRGWIMMFLQSLAAALGMVRERLLTPPAMVRLI